MSCRHCLALGTCTECYPSTGTVVPSGPGDSMEGPGAAPRPPKELVAAPGIQTRPTRIVKVRCSFVIEVEVPDDPAYDSHWDLEENHCAGTGRTGAAFDEVYEQAKDHGSCWACNLHCENKIVEESHHDQGQRIGRDPRGPG